MEVEEAVFFCQGRTGTEEYQVLPEASHDRRYRNNPGLSHSDPHQALLGAAHLPAMCAPRGQDGEAEKHAAGHRCTGIECEHKQRRGA